MRSKTVVLALALLAFSAAHAAVSSGPWTFFQRGHGFSVYLGPAAKSGLWQQYILLVYDSPQPLPSKQGLYRSEVQWLQFGPLDYCSARHTDAHVSVTELEDYFYASAEPDKAQISGGGRIGILSLPDTGGELPVPSNSIAAAIVAKDCSTKPFAARFKRWQPWKFLQHADGYSVYLGPAVRSRSQQYILLVYDSPQPFPDGEDRSYRSDVMWLGLTKSACYPDMAAEVGESAHIIELSDYFYASADPDMIPIDGYGRIGILGLQGDKPVPRGSVLAYIVAMDCMKWLAAAK